MKRKIEKAAVLGAGVMGAQIAALLATRGIEVILLDVLAQEPTDEERSAGLTLPDAEVRNRIARAGLQSLGKMGPMVSFGSIPEDSISFGNFEDDLAKIADCDWIVEAIVEDLTVKRGLLKRVDQYRKPGAVASSNTSGLSLAAIAAHLSEDFRQHWLGTHFFNPVRFVKLVEVVPTQDTLPEVTQSMLDLFTINLGKGAIIARDTPNFIANRIGVFNALQTIKAMMRWGLTVEEVDELTGTIMGRPRTATFRTMDLVGVDTILPVARNVYENAPGDEMRDLFIIPGFIQKMIENRWLGDKTGQGFFKRVEGEGKRGQAWALDYKTMCYRPRQKPDLPVLEEAMKIEDIRERIRFLAYAEDRAGAFVWETLSALLIYSANRVPEIADRIVAIDNAMKWGYNWQLGPFETWDALGVQRAVARLKAEGREVPAIVRRLLDSGNDSFYRREG